MIRPSGTQLTPEVLQDCITEHRYGITRLNNLYRYYRADHDILRREADNPVSPNNRLVAPNAYYITTIANGFTFANPLSYTGSNIDNLIAENKLAKVAAHDAELGENLSIFGEAYELIYMSKLPSQHVKLNNLDPRNTFVVDTNGIDPEPLFGVYYYPTVDARGMFNNRWQINAYDNKNLYIYEAESLNHPVLLSATPHYADQVPIVRYKNNDERMGDYERVLTLIDAYDRLQSDRIDDKDQFIDAIMAVYGESVIDDEAQAPEFVKLLKKYRILDNLDPAGRIEYLKKELDETGVETLRQALKADISKFSLVPELTDENFVGNASGVAMEYKTLGLKWLANIKRRMFRKSLDRRLEIMNNYMSKLGRGFVWEDVDVTFDDALPIDIMSYLPYAKEVLSRKTLVAFLANKFGITDVDAELKQIELEQVEAVERQRSLFDGGQNFGQTNENE